MQDDYEANLAFSVRRSRNYMSIVHLSPPLRIPTSGHWLGTAGHSFLFGVDYLHLTPYITVEPQEIAGHLGSDAHNGFRGEWSHEIDRNDG